MVVAIARAKHLITHVADDGEPEVIDRGAIAYEAGVLKDIGTFEGLLALYPEAKILGSENDILFPGFVNGHHHVGLTPVQLGVPDLPLELWLAARMTSRSVDLYLDTLYSAFEMIASGVTTVQHLRNTFPGEDEDIISSSQEVLRAYTKVGMRASFSVNVRDQHALGYFEDEQLLRRLPEAFRGRVARALDASRVTAAEGIDVLLDLRQRYAHTGLLEFQLMPANLHWCSDSALRSLAEFSQAENVPIHLHLTETVYQDEYAHRRAGHSGVEHVTALGLVSPLLTLGHGVWFSSRDSQIVAERGASICHNCSSNLRISSGIAPLNEWRRQGINIALGMDEAGINDDRDMLQEMRLALYLHRPPGLETPAGPSPGEVFRMATENGARTTPFANKVGVLKPGYFADFVLADSRNMRFPYVRESLGPCELLVQRLRSSDIHTVVVNGETIYSHGEFLNVDRESILSEIATQASEEMSEPDSSRRSMGLEVLQHVRPLYAGYLTGDRLANLRASRRRPQ